MSDASPESEGPSPPSPFLAGNLAPRPYEAAYRSTLRAAAAGMLAAAAAWRWRGRSSTPPATPAWRVGGRADYTHGPCSCAAAARGRRQPDTTRATALAELREQTAGPPASGPSHAPSTEEARGGLHATRPAHAVGYCPSMHRCELRCGFAAGAFERRVGGAPQAQKALVRGGRPPRQRERSRGRRSGGRGGEERRPASPPLGRGGRLWNNQPTSGGRRAWQIDGQHAATSRGSPCSRVGTEGLPSSRACPYCSPAGPSASERLGAAC